MCDIDIEVFTAIFMSLLIPIACIVSVAIISINKRNRAKDIRELLITNHTDAETAKIMLAEMESKPQKTSLRWVGFFLGVGIGALIDYALQVDPSDVYFWLIIAFGVGLGLLAAFIVETILQNKAAERERKERKESGMQ